jgi:hypothetical protein
MRRLTSLEGEPADIADTAVDLSVHPKVTATTHICPRARRIRNGFPAEREAFLVRLGTKPLQALPLYPLEGYIEINPLSTIRGLVGAFVTWEAYRYISRSVLPFATFYSIITPNNIQNYKGRLRQSPLKTCRSSQ